MIQLLNKHKEPATKATKVLLSYEVYYELEDADANGESAPKQQLVRGWTIGTCDRLNEDGINLLVQEIGKQHNVDPASIWLVSVSKLDS